MGTLTVIIPCYNGAHTLGATLTTLANQTRPADRVIVCDDGSTDDGAAVARAYGAQVLEGPFGGAAAARNAGLAEAEGADAIMFLDADDLIAPDTLGHLEAALPSAGLSRCDWRRYEHENEAWVVAPRSCAPRAPWQDDLSAWLTGWYCPPCAVMWTAEALTRAGPWWVDPHAVNEDGEIVMRALTAGCEMKPARGGTAFYRRPGFGEETVSGRRFAPESLRSRIDVVDAVAARLEAARREGDYDAALAEAYRLIAEDAHGEAKVRALALSRMKARGGGSARGALGARARRVAAGRREPVGEAQARTPVAPPASPAGAMRVSVIVPTYNRREATLRAVRSVLDQDRDGMEVIVVDDASTDDTAAAVQALGDDRVRVLTQPENRGVAAARNAGMAAAQGDAFAFLDSDDYWLPGKLAAQVRALRAAPPRAAICVTGYEVRRNDEVLTAVTPPGGDLFASLLARNVLAGAASMGMIRRAVWEVIGGFDTGLPAAEDWDFVLRASRFFDVVSVPEALAVHTDDEPAKGAPRRSRAVAANMAARDRIHARYGPDMRRAGTETAFLMESARRKLSEEGARSWAGRADVLRALRGAPGNAALYPWLGYMMAPAAVRAALRRADGREAPREV